MNKRELTTLIAERTGLKKKDVHATLQATIDCISEAIQAGKRVTFMGFGSSNKIQIDFPKTKKVIATRERGNRPYQDFPPTLPYTGGVGYQIEIEYFRFVDQH